MVESQRISFVNYHYEFVLLVMLDIFKAYDDCIDYEILLKKFENAGIRDTTLQWFESYFRGKGQKVNAWYLLRLILNIRDGSCSRIKSKLLTV